MFRNVRFSDLMVLLVIAGAVVWSACRQPSAMELEKGGQFQRRAEQICREIGGKVQSTSFEVSDYECSYVKVVCKFEEGKIGGRVEAPEVE